MNSILSTPNNLAALARDYAAYNHWANVSLAEWLSQKPLEQLDQEAISSFSSIRATLVHILNTQDWWMGNLKRENPENNYYLPFDGNTHELLQALVQSSAEFSNYLSSLTDEELSEDCRFMVPTRWPEWETFYRPRFEMIMHVMNHGTYHRGQVITIGRNVGITDAPMTDYMYYLLVYKYPQTAAA